MSQKKELKRAVKAVWTEIKTLRAEHGKDYGAEDIKASAEALTQHADALRQLGKQLSALDAMPPEATPAKPRKKKKEDAAAE